MMRDKVFLVGPMGAGKTTIGKLLAQQLCLGFCDTDRAVEERTGADISWIFDVEGEAGFRKRETTVLADMVKQSGQVLATGGGIILAEENRRLLQSNGYVVYLHTTVDQQVNRTAKDRKRPLLQNDDPEQVLKSLMAIRDPLYRQIADLIVETDQRSPKTVAKQIAQAISAD